jgi:hypothetical protein
MWSRQKLQGLAVIGLMVANIMQLYRAERLFQERNAWKAKAEQCAAR